VGFQRGVAPDEARAAAVTSPNPLPAQSKTGVLCVMPSTTIAGAKICCKCGADVAGKKRLKDHSGNYWCADCNLADEKRKRLLEMGICSACGQHFPGHDLTLIGPGDVLQAVPQARARKETGTFAASVKDMLSGSRDHEKRTGPHHAHRLGRPGGGGGVALDEVRMRNP
jgi:hypothetical protein